MLINSGVKRILVCAPSNAAIDEIVLRLSREKLLGTFKYVLTFLIHFSNE